MAAICNDGLPELRISLLRAIAGSPRLTCRALAGTRVKITPTGRRWCG